MAKHILVVGNRNYSSWSLRPYMALKMAGIQFDEKLVRFDDHAAFARNIAKISKAARVPVLLVNDRAIWDSLAILEYAAELKPTLWPANRMARAIARSVSAEMHSGFQALRNACPMNIRRPVKPIALDDAVKANVKRIERIWTDCRKEFGKRGPFLFGKFTNADAMFTPIASRIETFDIAISKPAKAYARALLETHAFQTWKTQALQEPWIVEADEVD
jgi:glutathione S-transferase